MTHNLDPYSYNVGVMDCFCEMVSSGLKKLAMSHPLDTKEERDSYLEEVKALCRKYEIRYYPEDEAFLTDLFLPEANKDKYNYLFYRDSGTLDAYLSLKKEKARLESANAYQGEARRRIAEEFGRLLSYPEDGISRLIEKTARAREARAE